MLGRVRRTSRLDVALSLAFAGAAYLVWALVAGFSRELVKAMLRATEGTNQDLVGKVVRVVFLDMGVMIDIVGLVWLFGSLALMLLASRQRISISWSFVSAMCQTFVAALGAVLVGYGVNAARYISSTGSGDIPTIVEKVGGISLTATITLAVTAWVLTTGFLLFEKNRWTRRGRPSLRDGQRSSFSLSRRRV
ncbi:MAG: hypothetical protein ACLFUJ_09760 [Phycisphaerae bacterium]